MGYNLYVGYYPDGNGSFLFGPSLDLVPILDDAVRDQIGTQKALGFIRADAGTNSSLWRSPVWAFSSALKSGL